MSTTDVDHVIAQLRAERDAIDEAIRRRELIDQALTAMEALKNLPRIELRGVQVPGWFVDTTADEDTQRLERQQKHVLEAHELAVAASQPEALRAHDHPDRDSKRAPAGAYETQILNVLSREDNLGLGLVPRDIARFILGPEFRQKKEMVDDMVGKIYPVLPRMVEQGRLLKDGRFFKRAIRQEVAR